MFVWGKQGKGLDMLCYRNFREKVATKTSSVPVHTLPPTAAAAAKYHNECVYYQTMIWMGIGNMNAEEWGWALWQ